MKLPDNETRPVLSNPYATFTFTLHSYLLFPYICSLESVRSVFLHLPSSRHTNKTQWQPFLFTELSSPEFMMYLPSLVFTACWILLLSLASSHFQFRHGQWASSNMPFWTGYGRLGEDHKATYRVCECCDGLAESFMRLAARKRTFQLYVHPSKTSL